MVFRPRDLASRMAGRRKPVDGYLRESFTLPRDEARAEELSRSLSQGGLYEFGRKLARTARWRNRIHDAAASHRRLKFHKPVRQIADTTGFAEFR